MAMSSFLKSLGHTGLHRPRLLGSAAIGIAIWLLLLLTPWGWSTRALVAWNCGVWPYLLSMGSLMLRCPAPRVKAMAQQENASSASLLLVMSAAAVLSLVAIVAQLARFRHGVEGTLVGIGLPVITVVGSWFLLGVVYTFHYAHMFYATQSDKRPLHFPEGLELPSFHDFLYFSFTIGAAVQTSDVTVLSTPMRDAVLAHSVLSFFFNVAVIGLSINIAAGLVGTH
jgi:uncharacterized membrane protein